MIAYSIGVFDILRAKDLQELDKKIQLSKQEGVKHFGIGIYENDLCEHLGFSTPLKSVEDRMNIMKNIRGIDFVFPVSTLQKDLLKDAVKNGYSSSMKSMNSSQSTSNKKYELGYVPGTYDLFHAGHLENLLLASQDCEKLVVGIKSDDLVYAHKNKKPIISENERMEILRHFRFVNDAYIYYTRDLKIAEDWFKSKYGKKFDAVFYGSDLKKDFVDTKEFNIIFTTRDEKTMKTRSSSAYRKLHLSRLQGNFSTGPSPKQTPLKINEKIHNNNQEYITDDIELS